MRLISSFLSSSLNLLIKHRIYNYILYTCSLLNVKPSSYSPPKLNGDNHSNFIIIEPVCVLPSFNYYKIYYTAHVLLLIDLPIHISLNGILL